MQIQERLIVPGLGVVVILSSFILGVPSVYKVLLGLLGLAAAGTYFAPRAVQVETRIAIAALGLIILLLITSTAFWLVLLSFGAIAALQIPHRHTLKRSPATIAWLKGLRRGRSGAPAGDDAGDDASDEVGEEAGASTASGDGVSAQTSESSGVSSLPSFVRMNVAGVGSLIFGVLIVVSVFIPWVVFVITLGDDNTETFSYTLRGAAETLEGNSAPGMFNSAPGTFFIILLVLGLLSVASIVLPRVVVALIAVAGFLVTSFSYLYLFGEQVFEKSLWGSVPPPGVGAATLPHVGVVLAAFCFVVIFLLQLIPALNRSRGKA